MRRTFLFLSVLAVCLAGCHKEGPKPGDIAAQAAKAYYDYLLQDKPEAFVDGYLRTNPLPPSYRSQLIDNARMFMSQQKENHGGIKSVSVRRAEFAAKDSTATVILGLHFADRDSEQVAVPMVCHRGVWYMR